MQEIAKYNQILSKTFSCIDVNQSSRVPVLVKSGTQQSGIGRSNNYWYAPHGGLWFSCVVLHEKWIPSLALYIGACLHQCLTGLFPSIEKEMKIKWPNDVLFGDRKLAGILVKHVQFTHSIHSYEIGIGINVNNPPDAILKTNNGVTLSQILGFAVDPDYLCERVISVICSNLSQSENPEVYISYCNSKLYSLGESVVIQFEETIQKGVLFGINSDGSIRLIEETGKARDLSYGTLRKL